MIKLPPLPHQKSIIEYMAPFDQFALIADCGIGKTYILLNQIEIKDYKKILVICPRSVMETAWGDDIPMFTDFSYSLVWHQKIEKRIPLLDSSRIHVINYDVIDKMYGDLLMQKYDCIILDECTFIKTHNSKRTKACIKLSKHIANRYILTGTPGFKPEKLWSPWYFMDPSTWDNKGFFQFREKYFHKIDANGLPLYFFNKKYIREINERMYRKGLRVLKDEVQAYLPKRNFIVRLLDMPADAQKIYETFDSDGVVGDIYTFFSAAQRMKLRQMANGSVINDQRGQDKKIEFIHDVKYREVERLLDEIPEEEQIIIWANFEEEFTKLADLTGFKKICGGEDNAKTIKEFKDGKIRGVIAHPKSVAHGITWTKCHINILFGLTDDLEYFQQSLDRTHRHGQIYPVDYHVLLCRYTIDVHIWDTHKKNKQLESDLTNNSTLKRLMMNRLILSELI